MSGLAKLQQAVQKNILTGDLAAREHVVGTRQVPVGTRLNIYREAYYLRLAEALATTYSALHGLLGERFAEICARAPANSNETDAAAWAARLLTQWVDRGWIVHLRGTRGA